ncbi:NAD(P)-binding protein [Rickenella mellea]|uniref:NAD(P)-binding protein n=1 Tax=Rickenella mellea TaxID=50990 RepID=A0A4Y7Q1A3_9AGAM|nr:NAD(P)-binding protein [Rickenella mellea]
MSGKKLIVVTGATGAQGGSVVRFLLEDGSFQVRAVTRNADSEKAKELAAKGVEVVTGNLNDIESVKKAFTGAYGVFGVTSFWDRVEGGGSEKEIAHGKNLVDAAKATNISHFVWSTLNNSAPVHAAHWDSKALVDDYLKASGVPRTSLYTACYYENFTTFARLTTNADGALEANWGPINWSDGPLGAYSVEDTGAFVLHAFKNPNEWIGKDIPLIAEIITARSIVKTFSEVLGKPIKLIEVSKEDFENAQHIPQLQELYRNNKWFYINEGNPNRDFALTKKIYPQVQSFETWAKAHINQITPQSGGSQWN